MTDAKKAVINGLKLSGLVHLIAMACDSCGTVHPNRTEVQNPNEWKIIATSDGWTFTGDGGRGEKHHCPKCSMKGIHYVK